MSSKNLEIMDEANEFYRAAILANRTVKRLQQEGLPADEAKLLVVAVINAEESLIMKPRHSFNETRVTERLQQLPEMPWRNG
jgi:hypothetical protein